MLKVASSILARCIFHCCSDMELAIADDGKETWARMNSDVYCTLTVHVCVIDATGRRCQQGGGGRARFFAATHMPAVIHNEAMLTIRQNIPG